MCLGNTWLTFVLSICFLFSLPVEEIQADESIPHGFKFGTSRKDALSIIESHGVKIVSDSEYSDDLRKIVIGGSVPGVSSDTSPVHETRLEFYKDKLMSSSILLDFESESRFTSSARELIDELTNIFGGAFKREKMFSYEVLLWDLLNTKVLLNMNAQKQTVEIEYVDKRILDKKTAKDFERRRKKSPGDPAKEMFIDNNYSAKKRR